MRFIDQTEITVRSGNGGAGSVHFRREKYVPRGGPDGGDGGRGGTVTFRATHDRNTLVDFRWHRVYAARNGEPGRGQQQYGASGEDLELLVPIGTVLYDADTEELIADLDREGATFEIPGGRGGKGNVHFKSSRHRTPEIAQPGEEGTELNLRLELKLLADVGLLGYPNAGKSTFISRISAARPRVADYPFTTLVPSLGVVELEPGVSFVVADIPGLIEGAAEGVGLGHQFLRHVERCAALAHLVSASPVEPLDAVKRYKILRDELEQFQATRADGPEAGPDLVDRPEVVLLTQIDLIDDKERDKLVKKLAKASGATVIPISSVDGRGIPQAIQALFAEVEAARQDRADEQADE